MKVIALMTVRKFHRIYFGFLIGWVLFYTLSDLASYHSLLLLSSMLFYGALTLFVIFVVMTVFIVALFLVNGGDL